MSPSVTKDDKAIKSLDATVGRTKRYTPAMPSAWLLRNVLQP
jgi:hypothetical protein